jgi:hypothetical protein
LLKFGQEIIGRLLLKTELHTQFLIWLLAVVVVVLQDGTLLAAVLVDSEQILVQPLAEVLLLLQKQLC